jgi:hypothetical protein
MKTGIYTLLFCISASFAFGQSATSGNTPQLGASGIKTESQTTQPEAIPAGQPQLSAASVSESDNDAKKALQVPLQPAIAVKGEAEKTSPKKD